MSKNRFKFLMSNICFDDEDLRPERREQIDTQFSATYLSFSTQIAASILFLMIFCHLMRPCTLYAYSYCIQTIQPKQASKVWITVQIHQRVKVPLQLYHSRLCRKTQGCTRQILYSWYWWYRHWPGHKIEAVCKSAWEKYLIRSSLYIHTTGKMASARGNHISRYSPGQQTRYSRRIQDHRGRRIYLPCSLGEEWKEDQPSFISSEDEKNGQEERSGSLNYEAITLNNKGWPTAQASVVQAIPFHQRRSWHCWSTTELLHVQAQVPQVDKSAFSYLLDTCRVNALTVVAKNLGKNPRVKNRSISAGNLQCHLWRLTMRHGLWMVYQWPCSRS